MGGRRGGLLFDQKAYSTEEGPRDEEALGIEGTGRAELSCRAPKLL